MRSLRELGGSFLVETGDGLGLFGGTFDPWETQITAGVYIDEKEHSFSAFTGQSLEDLHEFFREKTPEELEDEELEKAEQTYELEQAQDQAEDELELAEDEDSKEVLITICGMPVDEYLQFIDAGHEIQEQFQNPKVLRMTKTWRAKKTSKCYFRGPSHNNGRKPKHKCDQRTSIRQYRKSARKSEEVHRIMATA